MWLMQNSGMPTTMYQVAECTAEAHMIAMTLVNITKGFKRSGILTYNAHISEGSDFLTSAHKKLHAKILHNICT